MISGEPIKVISGESTKVISGEPLLYSLAITHAAILLPSPQLLRCGQNAPHKAEKIRQNAPHKAEKIRE